MSETEHLTGTLKRVEGDLNESLEDICKRNLSGEMPSYYKTHVEWMKGVGYRQFIILNDELFKVEYSELDPFDDIYKMSKNNDSYSFEVKYYNGGRSFDEAVEQAYENMNLEKQ